MNKIQAILHVKAIKPNTPLLIPGMDGKKQTYLGEYRIKTLEKFYCAHNEKFFWTIVCTFSTGIYYYWIGYTKENDRRINFRL